MDRVPRIPESEWQVMRILWAKAPATANEIVEALSGTSHWKPKTIKTLLNRLVGKKALGYKTVGRVYHYYALLDEHSCIQAESQSFLRRVYGGALMPMLAAFLEREKLSPEEIADLRHILDQKEEA